MVAFDGGNGRRRRWAGVYIFRQAAASGDSGRGHVTAVMEEGDGGRGGQ